MEIYLPMLLVSVILGAIVGHLRGYLGLGLLVTFLFGPLGLIIIFCLPNKIEEAKQKNSEAEAALRQYQASKRSQAVAPGEMKIPAHYVTAKPVPPPPGAENLLRIASGGIELGIMPIATVKAMVGAGKLSLQDHFLDAEANEWRKLESIW